MDLRRLLFPLAAIYGAGQWIDRTRKTARRFTSILPVISVGNLSVGGSGKTPLILYLVEQLQHHYPLLVLSRGYGRADKADHLWTVGEPDPDPAIFGDEPALIARALSNGAFAVASNRSEFLRGSQRFAGHVVLLDDGFQHYALARDLDIVIVDDRTVRHPFLIPAGDLREPLSALSRAGIVLAASDEAAELAHKWKSADSPVFRMRQEIVGITGWPDASKKYESVQVLALSGIARPERFFDSLGRQGVNVVKELEYPDHHRYSRNDAARIVSEMRACGAEAIVTTSKDAIKLAPLIEQGIPLYVAHLRVIVENEEALLAILRTKIAERIAITRKQTRQ